MATDRICVETKIQTEFMMFNNTCSASQTKNFGRKMMTPPTPLSLLLPPFSPSLFLSLG